MVDITSKSNTLRQAIAIATVTVSKQETIDAILGKKVPKGDVFEFSRAAGLLAIKKTSDVIPDCHPLPIEYAAIKHEVDGLNILITVEVHTIYKTGVEVEAMHGASVTALTMYDMLKPLDKGVEISNIKLVQKSGGKSDKSGMDRSAINCAVIVCSDTVSAGKQEDVSGKTVMKRLEKWDVSIAHYEIIPDDRDQIQHLVKKFSAEGCKLILLSGGTGLSPRDITPEAVAPLIDRPIPGIMETARQYGQQRTPFAMLSRGVAGFVNDSLVITLPGSVKGVAETMDALFPQILHVFKVVDGSRHE
ncbi:MAG: bifunctional molybdenum cofactor biosynthesis protein MoaC/MoaB [Sediminibacterium sp. Gen4]|uniref:bifunctional molybdenum cofactor biosynthesis protein MoaC/MoaB n=1 Tax=unclassified Sediminibacterium TaxID=2635961 RepID=UPI0015C101A5|nr:MULTISPECIES: bifunctional molybdenum cofactor biosynthesis protein MoaC/MoaB [unclassified Sediminibacterium]MBW0161870.1 bifunctional molybdenum cofactor biosynthesis protein MoaC/MoaB [Sediminibacterium sp.]MBW0164669.1 bifunctional molybdenum cofactor biosynthesis protein MoaC/MoaB [Sediminibacterium sp.]NWK66012.1 bifunctional molybdenum cofactor biosynthesis protein MoaC/MoaB [Sediminibacterium sp. Gen4]